jgi:hypothetical protein
MSMSRIRRLFVALRGDEGTTLAALMMMLLVVAAISTASVQIARHANDVTSVDRERLQTVEAAEAGVHDAIRRIEAGAGCDVSATGFQDLYDQNRLVGRFRTQIQPEAGTTCGQTLLRVIHAWGYAPTGGERALRHLEVTVKVVPQQGFPFTFFAEGSTGTMYVKNNGTANGDIYAEVVDQSQNGVSAENVISPGSIITHNNASYTGTLWAGGNVTVGENGSVGKSVIAAGTASGTQGTILLDNNSEVGGDALAKSTITVDNGAVVHGSTSPNNPNVPQPPVLTKPAFNYSSSNYSPPPAPGQSAGQVTTSINAIKNNLQGTFRANDSGGTVVIPDNVTITGDLTVVAAGKIDMGRTMSVVGGPWQVVMVAESTDADAIDIPKSLTAAPGIEMLLYANGGVDMKNHATFSGAVYANFIDAKNGFTVTQAPSLMTDPPVGFTFINSSALIYNVVPVLWREIVPGTPPA